MKEYTITMTSKGQFTMPIEIRRALELSAVKDKLKVTYNPATRSLRIEEPVSFEDIRKRTQQCLKPGTKPLLNPRAFYNTREGKK